MPGIVPPLESFSVVVLRKPSHNMCFGHVLEFFSLEKSSQTTKSTIYSLQSVPKLDEQDL